MTTIKAAFLQGQCSLVKRFDDPMETLEQFCKELSKVSNTRVTINKVGRMCCGNKTVAIKVDTGKRVETLFTVSFNTTQFFPVEFEDQRFSIASDTNELLNLLTFFLQTPETASKFQQGN